MIDHHLDQPYPAPDYVQPERGRHAAPEELMGQMDGRVLVNTLSRGVSELMFQRPVDHELTAEESKFLHMVGTEGARMARILLETTSNKMPGGHEIAPALAALYKADGDLHPERWQSYIPDPERGMPRENMRRLLNDHVDATYDESGRSRYSREDTAYAVMDIFSTIVEANPQGLTMNANVTAWIDSMAATYHSVFEPASDHPA